MHEVPLAPQPPDRRAANILASVGFAVLACAIYVLSPHTRALREFGGNWLPLPAGSLLVGACLAYVATTVAYYWQAPRDHEGHAVLAVRGLWRFARAPLAVARGGLPLVERLGILAVALKCFYAPLMVLSLCSTIAALLDHGSGLIALAPGTANAWLHAFNSHGFWFLFNLTLLVDVVCYCAGYLVEHPALDNRIRSVDPSLAGWAAALACYPPFNSITARILGGNVMDFPQFDNAAVHLAVNVCVLVAMAIYASASLAMGWKASNLTHRGIVCRGPYRFVRHPAYTAKNIAWWLAVLPLGSTAWSQSPSAGILVIGSSVAWSALYVLRALTEEDHLRSVDDEYGRYCEQVRYRFIPGIH